MDSSTTLLLNENDKCDKILEILNQDGEHDDITKEDLVTGTAMLSAANAATVLKQCGVKIRSAGRELTKDSLNQRL